MITVPNSAMHNAPIRHITPQSVQIIRLTPTEPDSINTPLGDTKIPDPTMVPIIRVHPLKKKIVKKFLKKNVGEWNSVCKGYGM